MKPPPTLTSFEDGRLRPADPFGRHGAERPRPLPQPHSAAQTDYDPICIAARLRGREPVPRQFPAARVGAARREA